MTTLETIVETVNNCLQSGDPTIRTWFLCRNSFEPILLISSYVLFVKVIGPSYMRDRKPFNLKNFIVIYNFSLVAFYIQFLIRGATFIPALGFQFFCGSLDSKINKELILQFFSLGWQAYFMRYVELLDTIFLVLHKKFDNVTKLHVIHHAVVPLAGYFGLRSETSAYLSAFLAINGVVHTVMYFYYGISALGPKYRKYLWWKKYLTALQIVQFLFITVYMLVMSYIGCVNSKATFVMCTFLFTLFLFLFINFYHHTFLNSRKRSQEIANGTAKLSFGKLENSTNGAVKLETNGVTKKIN